MHPIDESDRTRAGDGASPSEELVEVMPQVYEELRRLAADLFRREPANLTLQPTGLVHEAYLRLAHRDDLAHTTRARLLRAAAVAMRRILIDHARSRRTVKRGGDRTRLAIDDPAERPIEVNAYLVELNDALEALSVIDPRTASIVELRFFAGLSVEETAEATGLSPATVKREWVFARSWLQRAIEAREEP